MNNTLTKAGKDKDKTPEVKLDTYSNQNSSQTEEKGREKTAGEREGVGGKDTISEHENTTAVGRGDKYTGTIPEKTESEGRHEGEPEERNSGSGNATGGSEDRVGSKEPDNSLNAVELQEAELGKTSEDTQGSRDTRFGSDKTDATEISVTKDKGQREKERKELQVNGKQDPGKVGPNDTKLRATGGEAENTVEVFNVAVTENNTVIFETTERQTSNNSIVSPDKRRVVPARVNVTQYTMYRAGGEESGGMARKSPKKENKKEDSAEDRKREVEKGDKAKEREKEANQSFRGEKLTAEILNDCCQHHFQLPSVPPLQRQAAPLCPASTMVTIRWCPGWSRKRWSSSVTTRTHSAAMPVAAASQMAPGAADSPSVSEVPQLMVTNTQQIRQFNPTDNNLNVNTFQEKNNGFLVILSYF